MSTPETSYTHAPAGSPSTGAAQYQDDPQGYWPITKLIRCYTDYLYNKRDEIQEQIDARRYYHGSQWTQKQLTTMQKRRQPVMTFNRIARKVDGITGLIERLRQDPKAYARTPQHQEGADLASAVIRYVLDEQRWKEKSPQVANDGAVDGIGGVELELIQGDQGDPEIGLNLVDVQSFFYDPHSYEMDFSDAHYLGVGKWVDVETAKQMFPDSPTGAFDQSSFELVNATDRELRQWFLQGTAPRVRLVDIWYQHNGGWCWAIYTGAAKLMEGQGYLTDEKGKAFCKYQMFSANVDQDGDRYGFPRNMKSAQDGINAKQSKMQHMLMSKRLILRQGATDNIEKTRAEWAKPDGVVVVNGPVNEVIKPDDQSFDFAGLGKLLELNLAELENYGPNPALIGQGIENKSGRAIALLQQAGIAELGPYILAFKGWKLRVYRAIWNAIKNHWTAQRWIRVTDSQDLAQYVQINGLGVGPDGAPQLVNSIGALDVDIIIDEGPDQITTQQDNADTAQALASSGVPIPPQVLIELSALDSQTKKRIGDIMQQAQQAQAQQPQIDPLQLKAAEIKMDMDKSQSDMANHAAKTQADISLAERKFQLEKELKLLNANIATNQHRQQVEAELSKGVTDNLNKKLDGELWQRLAEQLAPQFQALADHINNTHGKIDALAQEMSAPVEIVRGQDGRPAQVKKGSRVINIVRDAKGMMAGAQ